MSTFLVDFRAALAGILSDFQAANPLLLRQTHRARPGTFNPPMAYVGLFNEPTIEHEFGNRQNRPEIRGQLVLVQGVYENAETADRLDTLTDLLLTYLPGQHARVSGSTLLEAFGHEYVDLSIAETVYAAVIVNVRLNAVA